MANKTLFQSFVGRLVPQATAKNAAGGVAYDRTPAAALAQYAMTGCFNATYYATATAQLEQVALLAAQVDAAYLAKLAIFARERGRMKDMPALLVALLATRGDSKLFSATFSRVINDGKMLRNFVQIMRSGVTGRKSLGTRPKKMVQSFFDARDADSLLRASVGQSPSMADVLKMVHPKPKTKAHEALYAHLVGRKFDRGDAAPLLQSYLEFKDGDANVRGSVPALPFPMVAAMNLSTSEWVDVARHASWNATRMNLNTFGRHGVFAADGMLNLICKRLADPTLVRKANAFPYQLLTAYQAATDVPREVKDALQDAMEVATENAPTIPGKVYLLVDVSGSMRSPATGHRVGATSVTTCVDVAALFAATLLRNNKTAEVHPFDLKVHACDLNPRDSVMTNATKLASYGGGGTNCSIALQHLNAKQAKGDVVIYVSDNESWMDAKGTRGTGTMHQWEAFRQRNPNARLVCIDIQPNATVQAVDRADILNIGGFSDQVFDIVSLFVKGELHANHWLSAINAINPYQAALEATLDATA